MIGIARIPLFPLCIINIINTMPPKTSKKIKELQLELKVHDSQLSRVVDYARKHPKLN